MNGDDFAAREQLAHAESDAVKRQLASGTLGDIDLTQPIRTPAQDRGKDTQHMTLRAATWIVSAVDDHCGHDQKFRYRSDFIRHYMVIGLAIERQLSGYDPDMDETVIQARLESKKAKIASLHASIDLASELLVRADGDPQRQEILNEVRKLRDIAEREGQIGMLRTIDRVIADSEHYR